MKSNCYLLFFGLFFFLVSNPAFSQKPVLTDEDAVTETVTKEIDEVFKSEDFLKKKNKKFKEVAGTMVVDIGGSRSSTMCSRPCGTRSAL